MSRQISELETILQSMIGEYRKLLVILETQQQAMKHCDLKVMDEAGTAGESCRMRIAGLETRRRLVLGHIAHEAKISGDATLRKLASLYPARADALLKLRDELKTVTDQMRARLYISNRVASAVLGHLNTVVSLVAGVVGKAGLYNKRGVPRMANRIGVMEAVG